MAEVTLQVKEWIADLIGWLNVQGEDKVRQMVRDRLTEIKADYDKSKKSRVDDGYKWNDLLTPNDNDDQWKHGGDCNLCRKVKFCGRQCKANKLLKKITTPFLYQMYLEEHPEAVVKSRNIGISPEDVVKMVNMQ